MLDYFLAIFLLQEQIEGSSFCAINTYNLGKLQSKGIQRTKKHSIHQLGCGIYIKTVDIVLFYV